MPTYALLGATGGTGSAILRCLLEEPPQNLTLNVFIRNKAKLIKAFPDLESTTAFTLNIIEGLPTESTSLQRSLKGADVVFMCIATNESKPGMSIAYDTASLVVAALQDLRKEVGASYTTPTILQLRTASLNETFVAHYPWLQHKFIFFCLHHVYEDLDRGCKLLQSAAAETPGLLDYIFADPPAIHDPDGTTRTGHKLVFKAEDQPPCLSYADLGAGMCELAERREEFKGMGVGVAATGKVNETWGILAGYLGAGARARVIGW